MLLYYERSQLQLHTVVRTNSYDEAAIRRYPISKRLASRKTLTLDVKFPSETPGRMDGGDGAVETSRLVLEDDGPRSSTRSANGCGTRVLRTSSSSSVYTDSDRTPDTASAAQTYNKTVFMVCVCVVHCVVCMASNTLKRHIIIRINITRQGRRTDGGRRVTHSRIEHTQTRDARRRRTVVVRESICPSAAADSNHHHHHYHSRTRTRQ